MKNWMVLIVLLYSQSIRSQTKTESNYKIDSVFCSYISFLKNGDTTIINKSDDTLCYYTQKSILIIDFFENITGIFLERRPVMGNEGIERVLSSNSIKKWEKWYTDNQSNLTWIDDGRQIYNSNSDSFRCINYIDFYPNNIRFVEKEEEIPKSKPPADIQNLCKKLHPGLSPLPTKIESNSSGRIHLK